MMRVGKAGEWEEWKGGDGGTLGKGNGVLHLGD